MEDNKQELELLKQEIEKLKTQAAPKKKTPVFIVALIFFAWQIFNIILIAIQQGSLYFPSIEYFLGAFMVTFMGAALLLLDFNSKTLKNNAKFNLIVALCALGILILLIIASYFRIVVMTIITLLLFGVLLCSPLFYGYLADNNLVTNKEVSDGAEEKSDEEKRRDAICWVITGISVLVIIGVFIYANR